MSILMLFLYIVIIGVVVWLIETYIPMAQPFKTFIRVAGIICCILLFLSAFGLLDNLGAPLPRIGSHRG